ncbi:hypothetical protein [Nitrosomonas sp.]|uniref:hypothetical protein n=1 Tax=Nitrosomonas sp. TaxID=42353 RepID=UPI0033059AD5
MAKQDFGFILIEQLPHMQSPMGMVPLIVIFISEAVAQLYLPWLLARIPSGISSLADKN